MTAYPLPEGFALRPYAETDRDWVAATHAAHYRTVEGFDDSFDAAVQAALAEITDGMSRDRTFGLILTSAGGAPVGSIFATDQGVAARLWLFLVDRTLQRRGFGKAMLNGAQATARAAGFSHIVVSTFDAHSAACGLYARAGFTELGRTPCTAFGRRMVRINFGRDLDVH